jgi:putative Ca2+/H+ antiporter (TMEM165/GDT1 family)
MTKISHNLVISLVLRWYAVSHTLTKPPEPQSPPEASPKLSAWPVFTSTFVTIFLAEMGDKTQVATLLMTAQSQHPWLVFAGAALALIATSLLGVAVGYWLSRHLTPKVLNPTVATLMLAIAAWLIFDIVQSL